MTKARLASALVWLWALFLCGPVQGQVRGLVEVHQTRVLETTVLTANKGWYTVYSLKIPVRQGDVLRVTAQSQMTLDSTSVIGQQYRLMVNGSQVGTQATDFNNQPGSHHLPMSASTLIVASATEQLEVKAEASAFHSQGDFAVKLDYSDNLDYGALVVEHYRDFDSWQEALDAGARFVSIHRLAETPALGKVGATPYQQESVGEIELNSLDRGDVIWMSAQTVGVARWGLEMVAGVLTMNEKAVSPYGGQNVVQENLFSPLQFEAYKEIQEEQAAHLEFRLYGGFEHGFVLYPESTRLDLLHFSRWGRPLHAFGQRAVSESRFPSNSGYHELIGRDLQLEAGDLIRLYGMVQFGQPAASVPVTVEARTRLRITGPEGEEVSFSLKNLTPDKTAVPVSAYLVARAPVSGTYRISMGASGHTDAGAVPMAVDAQQSQLQYLHYR